MADSFISFDSVKKDYQAGEVTVTALHDVSFQIEQGETPFGVRYIAFHIADISGDVKVVKIGFHSHPIGQRLHIQPFRSIGIAVRVGHVVVNDVLKQII